MHRETCRYSSRIFILIDNERALPRTGTSPVHETSRPSCDTRFDDALSLGNVCCGRRNVPAKHVFWAFQEEC